MNKQPKMRVLDYLEAIAERERLEKVYLRCKRQWDQQKDVVQIIQRDLESYVGKRHSVRFFVVKEQVVIIRARKDQPPSFEVHTLE